MVIEKLGPRKGEMTKMHNHGSGRVRMEFRVPSRGLIGLRSEMLTETRGTIVMNAIFDGYIPYQGEIPQRLSGALISDRQGLTTTYSLNGLQERGILFVGAGVEVYEGMVIGEHSRDNDLDVNCRPRKEDDQHARVTADEAIRLVPYRTSSWSSPSSSSPTTSWSKSRPNRCACARRFCRPIAGPSGGRRWAHSRR